MKVINSKVALILVLIVFGASSVGYASEKKSMGDMAIWYHYYKSDSENERFVAQLYLSGVIDACFGLGVIDGSEKIAEISARMAQIAESDAKHMGAPTVAVYLLACAVGDTLDGSKTSILLQKYTRFQEQFHKD